jgi:hypothetical protein
MTSVRGAGIGAGKSSTMGSGCAEATPHIASNSIDPAMDRILVRKFLMNLSPSRSIHQARQGALLADPRKLSRETQHQFNRHHAARGPYTRCCILAAIVFHSAKG